MELTLEQSSSSDLKLFSVEKLSDPSVGHEEPDHVLGDHREEDQRNPEHVEQRHRHEDLFGVQDVLLRVDEDVGPGWMKRLTQGPDR